jgi:hypothetical protein
MPKLYRTSVVLSTSARNGEWLGAKKSKSGVEGEGGREVVVRRRRCRVEVGEEVEGEGEEWNG